MSRSRMSSADAAWLHMDGPANLMIITGVMWFDERLDWKRVRDVIDRRLVTRYPKLRQRVVETPRGPLWQDDEDFDLDLHLHHRALPGPGDHAALQRYVGELMSIPLDRAKPLWQYYLVDGYGAGSALVLRMHHCIADGISILRLVLSMTDQHPDEEAVELDDLPARRRRGLLASAWTTGGAALSTGLHLATNPSKVADAARAGLHGGATLARLVAKPADPATTLKGELSRVKHAAWSQPLPLADVKAVGKSVGATVNDVLVAALAGGLRRYLQEEGSPVEDVTAVVPFNLRPLDRPVPRSLGNMFGLVYLPLPVGVPDPLERLAAVKRRMDAIKRSPEGPVSFLMLGAMGLTPAIVERQVLRAFADKGSLVVTNVPGPRTPIYFAGTRVAGMMSWVPQSGSIGLGMSILSYADQVFIGVGADAKRVPEPMALVRAFEHSFGELGERAGTPGVSS
jgi:diacylglycerol O-acyltransferase / wax synthase